jgi:hypothetical protein
MLPALLGAGRMAMQGLPYISAAIGGLPGLMKGNLGEAATGAGLGYLGGRFAKPGLAKGAGQVVSAAPGVASALGSTMPVGKALQLGALAGTGLAAGVAAPLIGRVAGAAAQPISSITGQAGRAATGAAGLGQQATGIGLPQLPDVPGYTVGGNLSQYGPPGAVGYADPTGAIQSQLRFENQQYAQSMANALRYAPYQEAYAQRSKEADLRRGAAAAQLQTALATDAAMRQQGQLGAQRMAEGLLNNIGQAAATQYRYF